MVRGFPFPYLGLCGRFPPPPATLTIIPCRGGTGLLTLRHQPPSSSTLSVLCPAPSPPRAAPPAPPPPRMHPRPLKGCCGLLRPQAGPKHARHSRTADMGAGKSGGGQGGLKDVEAPLPAQETRPGACAGPRRRWWARQGPLALRRDKWGRSGPGRSWGWAPACRAGRRRTWARPRPTHATAGPRDSSRDRRGSLPVSRRSTP